jgi:hypothetical protein
MKTFLVKHKDYSKNDIRVTLWQPPYEDENVLNKTGWKIEDVTITETNVPYDEEIR